MKVYTSNFTDLVGLKPVYDSDVADLTVGTLRAVLDQLEIHCPGFLARAVSGDRLSRACVVWRNVIEQEGRLYDGTETVEIRQLDTVLAEDDRILISLFEPVYLKELLESTLTETGDQLTYVKALETGGEPDHKNYKHYIDPNVLGPVEEPVYRFIDGETTLGQLTIPPGGTIALTDSGRPEPDSFDRSTAKLLPSDLVDGLAALWGLESREHARLRLFQEDALFFLMAKLNRPDLVKAASLLLSIPTGGGKTEAFLLPLIAHLLLKKRGFAEVGEKPRARVRSIIVYPTKALANDQARRISEILYTCNQKLPAETQVSLGILTGDTPESGSQWKLREENLFQVCPNPGCGEAQDRFVKQETEGGTLWEMQCPHCGQPFPFLRLTRPDILTAPPDILITNPDMINFCLQSPKMRKLFADGVDLMIFDEVHLCTSVFGCHVAHLLRRLEEASGTRPVYVGVSATIRNAVEVAALLFDTPPEEILYLRSTPERKYQDISAPPSHYRQHFAVRPARWKDDKFRSATAASVRMLDLLAHSVRDPHFRKTLAFSNFRQDTDDLVKSLTIQEDRYFIPYREQIRDRLRSGQPVAEPQAALAADGIGRWYELLEQRGQLHDHPIEVGWHRGGLEQKQRISAVNRFATAHQLQPAFEGGVPEEPIDVMISTNTLELGIDIGDVTTVVNVGAPHTTNEYAQRVGRGGRRRESAAVTMVNRKNPLDLYFWRHFEEYADPGKRLFEDAPIIVTNDSIVEVHLLARLLDYAAQRLTDVTATDIRVADLRRLTVDDGSQLINLMGNPEEFARALFRRLFLEKEIISAGESGRQVLSVYQDWLRKEHELLKVAPNVIGQRTIEQKLIDKCLELREKMDPTKRIWHADDVVTGLKAKDRSMVPRMRGAGQTVGLYLMREHGEELKDTISRRQAVQLRPPGGYATQGNNAFMVHSIKLEDGPKAIELRKLLGSKPEAEAYFKSQFTDFVSADDVMYRIPTDLWVRYSPFRFYCPNTRCGRTYTYYPSDGRCECGHELRQLTEVYVCTKPGCGEVHEPPVPRVCMNPQCRAKWNEFIRELNTSKKPPDYAKYFSFHSYPDLHWRCANCGLVFNYHNKHTINLPQSFMDMSFREANMDTPEGVAKHFQYRPEGRAKSAESLEKFHQHKAHFSCDACQGDKKIGKVTVSVVPTSRTVLVDYLVEHERLSEPLLDTEIGDLDFKKVDVVSLAKEQQRTFTNSKDETEVKSKAIFEEERTYLANLYGTHAAFVTFSNAIDEFLRKDPIGCVAHNDCFTCPHIAQMAPPIDDWEEIRPHRDLLPWEIRKQRNEATGKMDELPKRPDPRGGWCEIARRNECTRTDSCAGCNKFKPEQYFKYIIVNSLKHALLLAMPRFTGVDSSQMKGILNPNGKSAPELAITDAIEDGSGGLYLLRKNWAEIWAMTKEVIRLTAQNEGNLLLPYGATRYNKDLCPMIAQRFIQFLDERTGNRS